MIRHSTLTVTACGAHAGTCTQCFQVVAPCAQAMSCIRGLHLSELALQVMLATWTAEAHIDRRKLRTTLDLLTNDMAAV